jgi:LysM repeat protein
MFKAIVSIVVFFMVGKVNAQRMSVQDYVETYKDAAIAQMKRLGVPASIILAQGILETESGNSDLVKKSNNHFGIKCKSTWTGMSVSHTDDAPNECFRKYHTAEESYSDHSDYLYNTPRYASLFLLDHTDYKGWAYGLKKAGYATNPRYPEILINNIEKYNLQQYNNMQGSALSAERRDKAAGKITETDNTNQEGVNVKEAPKESNIFKKIFSGRKNKSNQFFNKLKAVMAFSGTSLLAIATENDIPLAKLLEYNDLIQDGLLKEDQWIYLEKKHKEGNRDTYTAIENESLYDISQNNGVQLMKLAEYNQLTANSIVKAGYSVKLRPGVSATALKQTAGSIHSVQAKEGLYSIAKKYNITVEELKNLNQLTGNELNLGQQLIIAK